VSLSFLTPAGAVVSLVAVVPVAAALRGGALGARVRSTLGLPPRSHRAVLGYVALAATVVLLGLAAAQPVLTQTLPDRVRADAQVLFVVDVSQSMAASSRADSATRLERARGVARRIRTSIPEVEAGVATLTDRVLPDLLPVADEPSFGATLGRSVRIEEPPPLETAVRATSFAGLEDVARGNYFAPDASKRVAVLLTDGETRPFDEGRVARLLEQRGISFEAVHLGSSGESIYDTDGNRDSAYVPDRDSRQALDSLAAATGGSVFDERQVDDAASHLRDELGSGPTRATGAQSEDEILLAPLLAALALIPFSLVVFRRDGVGTPLIRAVRRLV
jgi:hypothetical protein